MTTKRALERIGLPVSIAAIGWLHTLSGCALDGEQTSAIESEVSVSAYTTSGCSTSVVLGLSKQIADEIACSNPDLLVAFEPTANMTFTSNAVLPYMHSAAKTDLVAVAQTRTLQVNSGFRTLAQQYLLYKWWQGSRCGITAAATPGRSNHQSGRAVDISNYSSVISSMANRGWAHDVPGDPVHFDHLSSPDIRGQDVKAFQRLWNRNNPNDTIAEDGAYGPQTEARLRASPATGFAIGPSCTQAVQHPVDVLMIDGPDKLAPGAQAMVSVTLANLSGVDWPATTRVVSMDGALHDASWASATEVGTLGTLGAGEVVSASQGQLAIAITAPQVTEETAISTELALDDAGTQIGTIRLAVTVTPNGDEGTSSDSSDEHDNEEEESPEHPDAGQASGGCNAGGGAGWLLGLAAIALLRRRRH